MKHNFLNIGCGDRFHLDWTNLDFNSNSPQVKAHNLRQGLPFPEASFEAVYLSHVLEHFSRSAGSSLLRECHRVLRSRGIVRVVVPDLEQIASLYLEQLRKVESGATSDSTTYDWMTLELYDQTAREKSGGQLIEFIRNADPETLEFVRSRIGGELDRIQSCLAPQALQHNPVVTKTQNLSNFRRKLIRFIAGREGIGFYDTGRFRLSGEVHLWMYDRFSLARALKEAGFAEPRRVVATESAIPSWRNFNLDTDPDGSIYKPDSLYMEAIRL
jgi:SAM-dependent methyltransferase